jgi:hypothetical protein
MYARLGHKSWDYPLDTPGNGQRQHFLRPQIRVGGLLSNGYVIDADYMMGWTFDETRATYTLDPSSQNKVFKPFILAFHETGDDAAHPTFAFRIIQHEPGRLRCYVEVYGDDMRRILEYDMYSFDLGQMRRAQVSLGNGSGVVAVYREATTGAFVSLSIEPLANNRFLVEPLGERATVSAWLEDGPRFEEEHSEVGAGSQDDDPFKRTRAWARILSGKVPRKIRYHTRVED